MRGTGKSRENLIPWKPGQSGNPAGGKPMHQHAGALARAHTAEAIETLVAAMRSKQAGWNIRVTAANSLLDRGWGKPKEHVSITVDETHLTDAELESIARGDGPFAPPQIEGGASEVVH